MMSRRYSQRSALRPARYLISSRTIDNRYGKHATVLLILAGISSVFDRAIMKDMGDQMPLVAIVTDL